MGECKNNETFHVFGHFKVRRSSPVPMINVGKSWSNFLFSVIHTTLNWGLGGIYAVVSTIFAPGCRAMATALQRLRHNKQIQVVDLIFVSILWREPQCTAVGVISASRYQISSMLQLRPIRFHSQGV